MDAGYGYDLCLEIFFFGLDRIPYSNRVMGVWQSLESRQDGRTKKKKKKKKEKKKKKKKKKKQKSLVPTEGHGMGIGQNRTV
jgi:hypothetical protein